METNSLELPSKTQSEADSETGCSSAGSDLRGLTTSSLMRYQSLCQNFQTGIKTMSYSQEQVRGPQVFHMLFSYGSESTFSVGVICT